MTYFLSILAVVLKHDSNYHLERHKQQHTFMIQNVSQLQQYTPQKKMLPEKSDGQISDPDEENETDFQKFLQPDDTNAATIWNNKKNKNFQMNVMNWLI